MKYKRIMVKCLVKEIHDQELVILFADQEYKCHKRDITDYEMELQKMFEVGFSYRFHMWNKDNELRFSYKDCRPKLNKNRSKPIPTVSGFRNLNNDLHRRLKEYKFVNINKEKHSL